MFAEYEFTLKTGYIDKEGTLHKKGVMRQATEADKIFPQDPRVRKNQAYPVIVLLSRVIIKLGTLSKITPKVIEGLFSEDLDYLQQFYNQINRNGPVIETCPKCMHKFNVDSDSAGGS